MKSLLLVIILFSHLSWTGQAKSELSKGHIERHDLPCGSRGWYAAGSRYIGVCSATTPEALPMVILHESQHYLATHYGTYLSLDDQFIRVGLKCSKTGNHKAQVEARKFAKLGAWELHAQLPYLLHGKLCPKLQPWYPWFDLK